MWMAIMVFMYLTKRAPFMGNPSLVHAGMRPVEDLGMTRMVFGPDVGFEEVMVAKGEIAGCSYREIECSPAIYCRIQGGARSFRHALADGGYGHHLAVVYGDWSNELEKLAKIVGFKLELHR